MSTVTAPSWASKSRRVDDWTVHEHDVLRMPGRYDAEAMSGHPGEAVVTIERWDLPDAEGPTRLYLGIDEGTYTADEVRKIKVALIQALSITEQ